MRSIDLLRVDDDLDLGAWNAKGREVMMLAQSSQTKSSRPPY